MHLEYYTSRLEKLNGCQIIDGSLTIAWMKDDRQNQVKSNNLSFPELREIRGFLKIHQFDNLLSLKELLPNLAVIRGQNLHQKFALKITENKDLEEIGLTNLKHIEKGNINIEQNPKLCFVETINWQAIAPNSDMEENFINVSEKGRVFKSFHDIFLGNCQRKLSKLLKRI